MAQNWEEKLHFSTHMIVFPCCFCKLELYSKLFQYSRDPVPKNLWAISHNVHNPHPKTHRPLIHLQTHNAYLLFAYTMRGIQKYVAPRVLASTFVPIILTKTCLENRTSLKFQVHTHIHTRPHGRPPSSSQEVLLPCTLIGQCKGQ